MSLSKKQNTAQGQEAYRFEEVIYQCAGTLFWGMVVFLIMFSLIFRHVTVDGGSMNDTLRDGDRLIVSAVGYTPKCGDIVVITHGEDLNEHLVKRVIAVEGQSVSIDSETGEVAVDGVLLKEYYIKGKTIAGNNMEFPRVIEDGYVFVMGDNREHSLDSRSSEIGLIPVKNIVGKVIMRIYPFDEFGVL